MSLASTREAEDEFEAAVAWYERRALGLGLRLLLAIDAVVARIAAHPRPYSEVGASDDR